MPNFNILDAQFQYINRQIHDFGLRRQPVISVDTKKKELIGEYHNQGQEWPPKKEPIPVKMHDFADQKLGKVSLMEFIIWSRIKVG